jgi:hypothetical protein
LAHLSSIQIVRERADRHKHLLSKLKNIWSSEELKTPLKMGNLIDPKIVLLGQSPFNSCTYRYNQ